MSRTGSQKATAVVTGGAGFIGSHMVDLLAERGFAVRAVDNLISGRESNLTQHAGNSDVTFERLDVRALDPHGPLFRGARYVFHFAGIGDVVPSIEHPLEYMATNVMGTVQVLEAARHANVEKLVYAASSSCYGLAETPTTEDHPIDLHYPYALSKYQGECAVMHWHQVYGLPANSIRIFNAFGTRSRTTGAYGAVFGVFLRQKLAGKPFTVVGDGTQTRDFVYVTDVARAFLMAAETGRSGRIYNVGAGQPQPVNRLVELLGGEPVYIPRRPGEPDCTWADTRRAREELGWEPAVTFEDGVARILERIDDWREAPLWDPKSIAEATRGWFAALSGERA
jgi:UDP-glucose 4-epimerase